MTDLNDAVSSFKDAITNFISPKGESSSSNSMQVDEEKPFQEGVSQIELTNKYLGQPDEGIEPVYPLEELLLGAGLTKKVAQEVLNKFLGPKVNNVITSVKPGKENVLSGRLPKSEKDITHASRNMSQAEVDSAIRSKRFEPNPNPNPNYSTDKTSKWWSPADKEGSFGRTWKGAPENSTVRVPIKDARSNRAVSTRNAEILNKETGKWEPLIKK
jgi:hypothetical protein